MVNDPNSVALHFYAGLFVILPVDQSVDGK